MTLAAAILFASISLTLMGAGVSAQSTRQSDSAAAAQQQTPPSETAPDTKKRSTQRSGNKAAASKRKTSDAKGVADPKKPAAAANCDPTPSAAGPAGSTTATGSSDPGNAQAPSSPETPKDCPPAKIVVRQGGISEQSIQLAGGSSGVEAKQKLESTNQMLEETEQNLKKAAGIQLSEVQQGSISQIRQFVDQSRSALAAADYERARTLAWKAKVLSDELLNPQR